MTKYMHFRFAEPYSGSDEKRIVATVAWKKVEHDRILMAAAIPSLRERSVSKARGRFIAEKRLEAERDSLYRGLFVEHMEIERSVQALVEEGIELREAQVSCLSNALLYWLRARIRRGFATDELMEACDWLAGEMLR